MNADKKGFGAVVRREDPYGFYIDKYIEISTQNAVYFGRYRGINENNDVEVFDKPRTSVRGTLRASKSPTNCGL